jgi:hypothetical protein
MAGVFGLARDRLGDLEATGRAFGRGGKMTAATEQISRLLHEAGETCHRVFRMAGGAGEGWASWYSGWLVSLSWLPSLLGTTPARSELTCVLVSPGKDCSAGRPGGPWEMYDARRIFDHFGSPGR